MDWRYIRIVFAIRGLHRRRGSRSKHLENLWEYLMENTLCLKISKKGF